MAAIDAHQHYWNPARGDYPWMPPDDPVLTRTYGPADLAPQMAAAGVARTVLVQAAPSTAETEYMLGIADATDHVAAVVGWIDFEDPADRAALDRFAAHPKFRGVRPMVQNIADDDWILRPGIAWALDAVEERGLTFDCLGFPRHLDRFLRVLSARPGLRAVVDHCMKPQVRDPDPAAFRAWAEGIGRIAAETGPFCKLSGIVTEADDDWSAPRLAPYVETVLAAFGPERVMWGSDWPVLRLRMEYGAWRGLAETLCAGLDAAGRARVFEGTAADFYRIGP